MIKTIRGKEKRKDQKKRKQEICVPVIESLFLYISFEIKLLYLVPFATYLSL